MFHIFCCCCVLWGCELSRLSQGSEITGTTTAIPQFLLLYVCRFSHLQTYRCVDLPSILVLGAEEPLLNFGYFLLIVDYGAESKGASYPATRLMSQYYLFLILDI